MATMKRNLAELETPAILSDEQLVRSCLQGNHSAWCALLERYRNLIFSIPIKRGFSREDAAEVFQEVCLKLLSHMPRLRNPRTLAACLITVTSRECSHWRRERARYCELDGESAKASSAGGFETTAELFDEVRREQALREALAEIDARCKEVVRSLFFATPAIPYEELAQRLGLATGSIGFIRMRCLKRLRRLLEKKGFS